MEKKNSNCYPRKQKSRNFHELDIVIVIPSQFSSRSSCFFLWVGCSHDVPKSFFYRGCYFQLNNTLKLGMSIPTAFRTALETWASWIDTKINPNRTRVFFRTFEPSHWRYLLLIAMHSMQLDAFSSALIISANVFSFTVKQTSFVSHRAC